jgi:hypothetical protein
MGYKNRKTREDYDCPVMCAECGTESGSFYRDTDDNDIICLDCLMNRPTQDEADFNEAKEKAVNLTADERNGHYWISCAHCGELIDHFREDDLYGATELLEEDKEHDCYPCVICGDKTDGETTIDGDYYCAECREEARKEDEVG